MDRGFDLAGVGGMAVEAVTEDAAVAPVAAGCPALAAALPALGAVLLLQAASQHAHRMKSS